MSEKTELTQRELAVQRMLRDGATAREVSEQLGLTARQVSWARQQIEKKERADAEKP